jgi:hypothetical protein
MANADSFTFTVGKLGMFLVAPILDSHAETPAVDAGMAVSLVYCHKTNVQQS